ncbi:FAD:protein FMN transferase [Carnobacterium funditum]|uniref:FAD:protein FMN transferase n=1 Tax=Carnobacterium funditum TaxID=2752 RepID=UPI00055692EE|nr:FAD:protein FMN transferase [Carnobacterium funditum]
METKNNWKIFFLLFSMLLFISGCSEEKETTGLVDEPYSRTEFLMGTVVNVKIYDEGKQEVLTRVFNRIEELSGKITVNDGKSEVEKINEQAGIKPLEVSDDVYSLLKAAYGYSSESEGSFDMTVGPLTNLWHIGFDDAKKPTQSEIDDSLTLVDYSKVELDDEKQTIFLTEKNMRLDLGAIAKGYITDEAVRILKSNGVVTAIVDLGGNIFVLGNSPRAKGAAWNVGIQNPFETHGEIIGSIPINNKTIVTSGIYERFIEVDGVKYHHLLNPKTGCPFDNDLAGVSIVADKSVDGDGLSTVVFSKGLEGGLDFINQREDVEAIFVTKDRYIYLSEGLKNGFRLNNDEFNLKN